MLKRAFSILCLILMVILTDCQRPGDNPVPSIDMQVPAELRGDYISFQFEAIARSRPHLYLGVKYCRLTKDSVYLLYTHLYDWNARNEGFKCEFRNNIIYVDSVPWFHWKSDTLFAVEPSLGAENKGYLPITSPFPETALVRQGSLRLIRSWDLPYWEDTIGLSEGKYFKFIKQHKEQLFASPDGNLWFLFDPISGQGAKNPNLSTPMLGASYWNGQFYRLMTNNNQTWLGVDRNGTMEPKFFASYGVNSPMTFQTFDLIGMHRDRALILHNSEFGQDLITLDMKTGKLEIVYKNSWNIVWWFTAGSELLAHIYNFPLLLGTAEINGTQIVPNTSFSVDVTQVLPANSRYSLNQIVKQDNRWYLLLAEYKAVPSKTTLYWVEWNRG